MVTSDDRVQTWIREWRWRELTEHEALARAALEEGYRLGYADRACGRPALRDADAMHARALELERQAEERKDAN